MEVRGKAYNEVGKVSKIHIIMSLYVILNEEFELYSLDVFLKSILIISGLHLTAALRALATSPGGEKTFGDGRVDLTKARLVRL